MSTKVYFIFIFGISWLNYFMPLCLHGFSVAFQDVTNTIVDILNPSLNALVRRSLLVCHFLIRLVLWSLGRFSNKQTSRNIHNKLIHMIVCIFICEYFLLNLYDNTSNKCTDISNTSVKLFEMIA